MDILWEVLIYAVTFIITYRKSGSTVKEGYVGDRSGEYQTYCRMIERRGWYDDYLLNTCLFSTYFPSLVYRMFKRWKWEIFRASAPVFYALVPAFTYLTARYYFDTILSLTGAAFVLSHFYFMGDADTGRNGIAGGLIAVSLWGLLGGQYWVFGAAAVLVVFAHYTASFIYFFVLVMTALLNKAPDTAIYVIIGIYTVAMLLWYGVFTRLRELYLTVIKNAVKGEPSRCTTAEYDSNYSLGQMVQKSVSAVKKRFITKSRLLLLTTVVILGFIAGGYLLFYHSLSPVAASLTTSFLLVTCIGMISPALATAVGIYRIYFTGVSAITLLFLGFVETLSGWTGFTAYGIATGVIIVYALCNNGGMAYLLGEK